MKKLLAGAAVAGTLFAGVYAFAAGLNVDSNDLAAGTDDVAACMDVLTEQAHVAYADVNYNATTGKYDVAKVSVSLDEATACNGQSIEVTLADGNDSLGSATGTIASGAANNLAVTATDADPVDANSIDHVAVVLTGNQP